MNNTDKFSGRAAVYDQCRPDYPEVLLEDLMAEFSLTSESVVADIGAGTGIFTRQLLAHGLNVIAVEPNADMRHVAQGTFAACPKATIVSGSAACTGLPAHSIDFITAAQAFHWFEPDSFHRECLRILKPGAAAALLWNNRDKNAVLTGESERICGRYCPAFDGFSGGTLGSGPDVGTLFRAGYSTKCYPHPLTYDRESFIGRYLSASYAPKDGDAAYRPFIAELSALFDKHSRDGKLIFPNITSLYYGQVC
ncbi:MAG: methyltransferase domain-containing protein [Sporolactobacillus sp.]